MNKQTNKTTSVVTKSNSTSILLFDPSHLAFNRAKVHSIWFLVDLRVLLYKISDHFCTTDALSLHWGVESMLGSLVTRMVLVCSLAPVLYIPDVFLQISICYLFVQTLASCTLPGNRTSISVNIPFTSHMAWQFKEYFILEQKNRGEFLQVEFKIFVTWFLSRITSHWILNIEIFPYMV